MHSDSSWPPVKPGFINLVRLGNYHHFVNPGDQKVADYLNMTVEATQKVDAARQLFREGSPFLLAERSQFMEQLINDVAEAVERVAKLLEPGRIDQVSEESVRFNMSAPLLLQSDDPKAAATFGRLALTCDRMETVLHDLQNITTTAQLDDCSARATTAIHTSPEARKDPVYELDGSVSAGIPSVSDRSRASLRRSQRRSTIPQPNRMRARSISRRRSKQALNHRDNKVHQISRNVEANISTSSLCIRRIPEVPSMNKPRDDIQKTQDESHAGAGFITCHQVTSWLDVTEDAMNSQVAADFRGEPSEPFINVKDSHRATAEQGLNNENQPKRVVRRKPVPPPRNALDLQKPNMANTSKTAVAPTASPTRQKIPAETMYNPYGPDLNTTNKELPQTSFISDFHSLNQSPLFTEAHKSHVIHQIDPEVARLPSLLRPGHKERRISHPSYNPSDAGSNGVEVTMRRFRIDDKDTGGHETETWRNESPSRVVADPTSRQPKNRWSVDSQQMSRLMSGAYPINPPTVPEKPAGYLKGVLARKAITGRNTAGVNVGTENATQVNTSNTAKMPFSLRPNPLRLNPPDANGKSNSLTEPAAQSIDQSKGSADTIPRVPTEPLVSQQTLPKSATSFYDDTATQYTRDSVDVGTSWFRGSYQSSLSTTISSPLTAHSVLNNCTNMSYLHNVDPIVYQKALPQRPQMQAKPNQNFIYIRPLVRQPVPHNLRRPNPSQPPVTGLRRKQLPTVEEHEVAPSESTSPPPMQMTHDITINAPSHKIKKQPSWFVLQKQRLMRKK